jgi:hypothetical protein
MLNYDPNIRNGKHTIRVTIQQWEYKGHIDVVICGNRKGSNVMDSVSYTILDNTPPDMSSDCNFTIEKTPDNGDWFSCILKSDAGDTLDIEDECDRFDNMIVAVEIIDFIKE